MPRYCAACGRPTDQHPRLTPRGEVTTERAKVNIRFCPIRPAPALRFDRKRRPYVREPRRFVSDEEQL